jgi:hypothetical protein
MNAIMDLTARSVSFITAIQTTLLKGAIASQRENENTSILNIMPGDFEKVLNSCIELEKNSFSQREKSEEDSFSLKSIELVWISKKSIDIPVAREYASFISVNLVKWIWGNKKNGIFAISKSYGLYPTPYNWREAISRILYSYPEERLKLASALQYMPIQVILALGAGTFKARTQRILQMWGITDDYKIKLMNKDEVKLLDMFSSLEEKTKVDAKKLLTNDHTLSNHLIASNVPLSFEQVFTSELKEIATNRARRIQEHEIITEDEVKHFEKAGGPIINDPYEKGKQMGLYSLGFSGGGIRSATFNLGILQGLAKKNLISKFDYLSTVSGGGYIGSWLAAWIKRDGSVVKVTNRLCPDKSPDPLGEELSPIRWLRMYSNYFAPNASIMSADSWTIGVTWLRNTLLNQVIIFLLLLSLLFAGNLLFEVWRGDIKQIIHASMEHVLIYSLILLLPVSLLAGLGMHAYHSEQVRGLQVGRKDTKLISSLILALAFIGAYLVSGWLSSPWYINNIECASAYCKIKILAPVAIITFLSLMLVAFFGNYVDCLKNYMKNWAAWAMLIITTIFTSLVGLLCLYFAWELLQKIDAATSSFGIRYKTKIEFILGLPLVLEVFSITVVARMAFLGRYFPDERREWWGRIGAYVHRTSFLWISISALALIGRYSVHFIFTRWWGIATTGGWVALVISAVKAAFSSKTSGKEATKNSLSAFLNILGLLGPYLFLLGLLVLLPGLIKPLKFFVENKIFHGLHRYPAIHFSNIYIISIMLFCFLVSLLLSMQIGVNEFSMHHFYRNRLVRAYLGATRRYADRQRTYNPFTSFDMLDDENLGKMRNEYGYYGPYPVLNTALNASQVTDLDRQDRKAESFIFSPLYCGFDFSMIKSADNIKVKSYDYAYRETKNYAYKDGPHLGTAMAISGAAVNPNQGYHSSAATAFLLTVFNVQLGWWMGNPRKSTWQRSEPRSGLGYIMNNLIGKTNTRNDYVALSDGGHFDNMGLYEMIRRKCSFIILCDAEQDNEFTCEGFANAIRRCRIDFGADIDINISKITKRTNGRFSEEHYALGKIYYAGDKANAPSGKLLYIKSSITGNEPVDVFEYAVKNKTFPHQTTADQFFDEEQFESYRKLGLYIADKVFNDANVIKEFKFDCKN